MPSTTPTTTMKRNRLGVLVVAASLATLPAAMAMATAKAPTKAAVKVKMATPVKVSVAPSKSGGRSSVSRRQRIPKNPLQYYDESSYWSDEDYEEDEEDVLPSSFFRDNSVVDSVKKLQRSTKSEILNDELQQQIDSASTSPNRFLDAHVQDASMMEKVAMSSIPQQLPRPAIDALNAGANRVSHEQELELGRMIQRGVALHKMKADFEDKEGREISRHEWTELAQLDSPKELRKQVLAYRQAKQLLVSANMGLVHAVVKKQYKSINRTTGLSKDELVQEGSLGLLRAAELFDPSRGLRFSTYATIWIKGTLQNSHITDGSITLPQREKTKWNKIVKAHGELKKMNGGEEATIEEIAKHLGMKVADVLATKKKMTQAQQIMSLDYEYATQTRSGTETGTDSNKLENNAALQADADLAERTQMHADVVAAMARNLDAREARLMRLRYGLGDGQSRSLKACAEAMGLSETRVQQLAKQCLKKLREAAEAESLEEYLLTVA